MRKYFTLGRLFLLLHNLWENYQTTLLAVQGLQITLTDKP